MSSFGTFEANFPLSGTAHNVGFLLSSIIFLFIPGFLFVVGPRYFSFGVSDVASREYWKSFGGVGMRMLCWFLGAGAAGLLYSLVEQIIAI